MDGTNRRVNNSNVQCGQLYGAGEVSVERDVSYGAERAASVIKV